jgi:hypothetical protein
MDGPDESAAKPHRRPFKEKAQHRTQSDADKRAAKVNSEASAVMAKDRAMSKSKAKGIRLRIFISSFPIG